jgi:hypothetical protein
MFLAERYELLCADSAVAYLSWVGIYSTPM